MKLYGLANIERPRAAGTRRQKIQSLLLILGQSDRDGRSCRHLSPTAAKPSSGRVCLAGRSFPVQRATLGAYPDEVTIHTAHATATRSAGEPRRKPGRITSLDACRGLLLVLNVIVIAWLDPEPLQLKHAQWIGVRAVDLIFPTFVTLSGCGLAFAYRRFNGWRRIIRRSIVLLLGGLAFNAIMAGSLNVDTWRLTGVLQLYAALVLIVAALHVFVRGPAAWAALTAAVAALQFAFLSWWQSGCRGGELTPECNPSRVIDPAVFGAAHTYVDGTLGHDPEGLVSLIGALVVTCVGMTAGQIVLTARRSPMLPAYLAVWGGAAFGAGLLAAQSLPVMKRLWTTPFALTVSGAVIVVVAAAALLLDLPARRRVEIIRSRISAPLVAMGRNALLIYFGSHIVMHILRTQGGEPTWARQIADNIAVAGYPRVSFIIFMLAVWLAIAAVLHRYKVYIRA